jgi:hypothetical protein
MYSLYFMIHEHFCSVHLIMIMISDFAMPSHVIYFHHHHHYYCDQKNKRQRMSSLETSFERVSEEVEFQE